MKRVNTGPQIIERLAQGQEEIFSVWETLPATRHEMADEKIWSFDCFPIDISASAKGILSIVHGEFEENNPLINEGKGGIIKRSFDRTFVLSKDEAGCLKVMSDTFVIRSYAGSNAWNDPVAAAAWVEEKKRRCDLLAKVSGLTLHYSEMCLGDVNWDLSQAWNTFEWAKVCNLILRFSHGYILTKVGDRLTIPSPRMPGVASPQYR